MIYFDNLGAIIKEKKYYGFPTQTKSGSAVTFSDCADAPFDDIVCQINAVQTGSGDPSPSNVRPILQMTTETITTMEGKNFLSLSITSGEVSGITYTLNNDGTITASGRSSEVKNINIGTATLPKGTFVLSGCVGGGSNTYRLQVLDSNGGNLGLDTGSGVSFSLDEAMTVSVRIQIRAASLDISTTFSPMIRVPSATADFEKYKSAPVETMFPLMGNCWGGNVSTKSGVVTKTFACVDFTGDESWTIVADGGSDRRFRTSLQYGSDVGAMCSHGVLVTSGTSYSWGTFRLQSGQNNKYFILFDKDSYFADTTALKNYLRENPIQLVYQVETPTTTQIPPIDIPQNEGTTTVWCSTGDLSATARVKQNDDTFKLLYQSGTAGNATFKVPETAKYLIVSATSHNGTRSVILPTGRTADVTASIGSDIGFDAVVADLQTGDTVTMANTVSSWAHNMKAVFKLTGIDVDTVADSSSVTDGTMSYTPTGTGEAVILAVCGGRTDANEWDKSQPIAGQPLFASFIGTNEYIRLVKCDLANAPTISMYGYDGGGCNVAVLNKWA